MNKRLNIILLTLLAFVGVSLSAAASYLPFNTNVNMNVGIGTSTPQGALTVMNGNVGIGTWAPTFSLAVNGTGDINGALTVGGNLSVTNFSNIVLQAGDYVEWNGSAVSIQANTAPNSMRFNTFSSPIPSLFIDGNGNVGIGTIIPVAQLAIVGNVGIGTGINSPYVTTTPPSGGMIIQGNVGIGSLHPGTALDVNGTVRMTGLTLNQNPSSGYVLVGNGVGVGTWMAASTLPISGASNTSYWLNDTGNVGINTAYNIGVGTISQINSLNILGNIGVGTVSYSNYLKLPAPSGGAIFEGSVGIGTWVPNGIDGENAQLSMVGGGSYINLGSNPNGGGPMIDAGVNPGINDFQISINDNSIVSMNIAENGADGWGDIGIDWNGNQTAHLDIQSSNGTTPSFNITNVHDGDQLSVTGAGNMGIGTFVPLSRLNVNGGVGIGTTLTNGAYLNGNSAPSGGLIVQNNVGIGTFNPFGGNLIVNGGGNVGIGSLVPGTALDVNGTVRMTGLTLNQNPSAGYVLVGNGVGVGTWMSASTLTAGGGTNYWLNNVGGNVGISTAYAVGIGTSFVGGTGEAAFSVMNGNVGIGTWLPLNPMQIVGIGTLNSGSGLTITNGNVGIGTWLPAGYVTVENAHYNSNMFILNNGTVGLPLAYPNAYTPTLVVNDGELTGSRPLWFGYKNAAVWDSFVTLGACGAFTQMCLDLGTNATINSSLVSSAANLAIGGTSLKAGLLPGFSADDGNAVNIYFGNTGNTLIPNGSVGIGTVSPTGALEIEGGNVGIGTWTTSGGQLIISTRNGNVGIGTITPGTALDVNGTARMTGFTLTGNGAASGNVMVSNGVGVGTWMPTLTLPIATVTTETPGDVTYYNTPTGFAGGSGFQTNGTNVGIGTSNFTNASLQIVGNIGIGTVKNGDNFINTLPPNGGMIVEGNVGIGTWTPSDTFQVGKFSSSSSGIEIDINGNVGMGTTITSNASLSVMNGNVGIGTWVPSQSISVNGAINTLGNTSNSYLNSTGGNVGIGSTNPGQTLDVNGRVRSVGIGTTVPEPACLKADGTIGYYSTPTWQGTCS